MRAGGRGSRRGGLARLPYFRLAPKDAGVAKRAVYNDNKKKEERSKGVIEFDEAHMSPLGLVGKALVWGFFFRVRAPLLHGDNISEPQPGLVSRFFDTVLLQ